MPLEMENCQVNLAFCTPNLGLSSTVGMAKYVEKYLGLPRTKLFNALRGSEEINTLDLVMKRYGFETTKIARVHFEDAQRKYSNNLIYETMTTYGLDPDRFGLKDEVNLADPQATRMLAYANQRPSKLLKDGSSPRSQFETIRHLVFTDLGLRLEALEHEEDPNNTLSELQRIFNNELYEGPAGSSTSQIYYTSFDNENSVQKIERFHFPGSKVKRIDMRTVKIGDKEILVRPNFDVKEIPSQMRKLITDHLTAGKLEFDPQGNTPDGGPNLADNRRFDFVIDGGEEEMQLLRDKIDPLFDTMVERERKITNKQNQAWAHKYIAYFQGAPVEVLFHTVEGHILGANHIGKIDPKTGLYDGKNHELYEVRRALDLLMYIYPYEVYGSPDQNREAYRAELLSYAQVKSEEIANDLRKRIR